MNPQRHLFVLALLFWTAAVSSQTLTPSQTTELVREAVASLSEQSQATHRFTYFELARTQNRNEKGKLYFDRSTLTETTYIADLPYERLLEVDGKPLTGKALADEQARYDQAIHDRAALDNASRARIDHQLFVKTPLPYSQLTTRFRLTELRQETLQTIGTSPIAGQLTHVIDAVPIPSTDPALPTESRHIKLWIAASTTPGTAPQLLRADFDYLTPETISDGQIESGSRGSILFSVIDGIAVRTHQEIHSRLVPRGSSANKAIQVDVDRTYSRYRQFTSSIRIVPTDRTQ